jgi:hypothetical protein
MVWKDKYPKSVKPSYNDLLDFFDANIRELFLTFDREMRSRFTVHNKYHRFLKTLGWAYGYGRSYNCELLCVTVGDGCFYAGTIDVRDSHSLNCALEEAGRLYNDGFEKRYAEVSSKHKAGQIERTKRRVEREKAQMDKLIASVDPNKFNKFRWCKKVSRDDLVRLYAGDAKGLIDVDLLDDIGFTFYTRCVQGKETRAHMSKGEIICHHCGAVIKAGKTSPTGAVLQNADNDALMHCDCGYVYTYREYRRSCNAVNIPGGRATPLFEHFIVKWPACRNVSDKMMIIDWLIHECHVTLMSGMAGRSVCVNLIEGTLKQIGEMIEQLAYGDVTRAPK